MLFLDHCEQSSKFHKKRMKKVELVLPSHNIKWKIMTFSGYYGSQSCSAWHYITLMLSQCIIFLPAHNDRFRQIMALLFAICSKEKQLYKITSPLHERNQHFDGFHNIKFCHIPLIRTGYITGNSHLHVISPVIFPWWEQVILQVTPTYL